MSGLFGRPWRRRRTRGKSFVQSRWSSRESLVRVFFQCAIGTFNFTCSLGVIGIVKSPVNI
jgi:hypothetical protein